MKAENILSSKDFRKCAEFHGHVCPGLAIGFKAAQTLMERLGAKRAADEELVAIVETDACGADAVQVLTGCTFGKGNFFFRRYGKHAFSLCDRKKGKIFRASLRSDAIAQDPQSRALAKKVNSGEATEDEKERFKRHRGERLKEILEAAPEKLFIIKEIKGKLPPQARLVESRICDRCKELTMVNLLRKVGKRKVCISCAKKLSGA